MSIVPMMSAARMVTILLKAGFKIARQKGSHVRLEHPITKKATTVAMHAGDLSRDMVSKILKQAGLSVKVLLRLLGK